MYFIVNDKEHCIFTQKNVSGFFLMTAGIKANSTNELLWLLLLQVEGGHGAIKKEAVWLRVGMVVGLLGEDGKLLLTNDGSKKASFL